MELVAGFFFFFLTAVAYYFQFQHPVFSFLKPFQVLAAQAKIFLAEFTPH